MAGYNGSVCFFGAEARLKRSSPGVRLGMNGAAVRQRIWGKLANTVRHDEYNSVSRSEEVWPRHTKSDKLSLKGKSS